jgi:hypothetical protein
MPVSVDLLWEQWSQKVEQDQTRLPTEILRNRCCNTPFCLKENQKGYVVMRQRSDNGVQPSIPSDMHLPLMVIYGANATPKLRKGEGLTGILEGAIYDLDGPNMAVAKLKIFRMGISSSNGETI